VSGSRCRARGRPAHPPPGQQARVRVAAERVSPRIATVAVDLVRHDLIMTQAPVPFETLVEIVDKIFLPLVGVA
jgi:hypothetical protein